MGKTGRGGRDGAEKASGEERDMTGKVSRQARNGVGETNRGERDVVGKVGRVGTRRGERSQVMGDETGRKR